MLGIEYAFLSPSPLRQDEGKERERGVSKYHL